MRQLHRPAILAPTRCLALGVTLGVAVGVALGAPAAHAQDAATPVIGPNQLTDPPPARTFQVRLGAGAIVLPNYPGSKTDRVQPLPSIDAQYGDLVSL